MRTQRLQRRLTRHEAVVGVVGQGYVGLSLAASAAVDGLTVRAVDVDGARIRELALGRNVVPGVDDAMFAAAVDTGRLSFDTDPAAVADCDVVVICVPTPVVEHRPDLSFIEDAGRAVAAHLQRDSLVILESTTYPGTTDQILRPLLEAGGLRAGRDFLLAYSPERIDPGNVKYGLRNTPRVVGGIDEASSRTAGLFYSQLVDDVEVLSSCRAAEMAKLLENTFRMVNIALVNELATLCGEQNIDVWEVIRAAATKPFGFMPFYPGPGVGGHCIPLDPTYLAWQSRRDTGRPFRLVETAQDINAHMPTYVTTRVIEALSEHGKAVKNASVLALGVTYKPDVGDLRESAAIEVLGRLARKGARISFHDPFVSEIREHELNLRRSALTGAALEAADIVLLLTPHSSYDTDQLTRHAKLLFDARNAIGSPRPSTVVPL
ncbi:nucleotide sugar dehydrogenase [Blastococcus jejuensis]|uniref:Nucleotide sugar dehydrogenase n=1 Tax=Blastococcus jejuensis TaxID=351224 RepID=A0ABP6PM37_9ACTN